MDEDESYAVIDDFVTNNLFIEKDEINHKSLIRDEISKLMFLLGKVNTSKAKKLKRYLSSMSVNL